MNYFHDTYIDTSKIEVQLAKSVCVNMRCCRMQPFVQYIFIGLARGLLSLTDRGYCALAHFGQQLKDDDLERPWSKYSTGSSANDDYKRAKLAAEQAKEQAEQDKKKGVGNWQCVFVYVFLVYARSCMVYTWY